MGGLYAAEHRVVLRDNETSAPLQRFLGGRCSSSSSSGFPSGESLFIASSRSWSGQESRDAAKARISESLQSFDQAFGNAQLPVAQNTAQLPVAQYTAQLPVAQYTAQKTLPNSLPRECYDCATQLSPGTSLSVKAERGSTGTGSSTGSDTGQPDSFFPCEFSRVSFAGDICKHGELSRYSANPLLLQAPLYPSMDDSFELATNVPGPSKLSTQEKEELLILASVRQVLAKSPSYAEEVVLALKDLPHAKRDILFNHYWSLVEDDNSAPEDSSSDTPTSQIRPHPSTTNLETWEAFRATTVAPKLFEGTQIHPGVPGTSHVPADASGSRQVPSGQPSQARGGTKQTRKYRVQKLSRGKSKKKGKHPDEGGDGSGSGGGGGSSPPTGGQDKSSVRWACPYCLAFPHMLELAKFKSCRPPGSLNTRSLWKDHLKEYHSPNARPSNPTAAHALFYMNEEQWSAVQTLIAPQTRPRSWHAWVNVQKKYFLDVWHIIFPRGLFLQPKEPLSPFHPSSSELANLEPQSRILLEGIRNARARRAVSTGLIATVQDFRPSGEEYIEMMGEALAIMANMSPSASQWLVNVSPEGLQAAVEGHNQATPGPEAKNVGSENVTSPEPTPEPSPSGNLTDPVTASPSTFAWPAGFDHINQCIDPKLLEGPGR